MTITMSAPSEPAMLEELADTVNREHRLVEQAVSAALGHAIKAGEALLQARERVPTGDWQRWLKDNVDFSYPTATNYVRLAQHRDAVLASGEKTVSRALTFLRTRPQQFNTNSYSDDVRDAAQALVDSGLSYDDTAALIGVSSGTVRRWVDPAAKAGHDASRDRARKRRERATRAFKREEAARKSAALQREANKVGGSIARAYSDLRKCLQALDQARDEAVGRETKIALNAALTHAHRTEDAIGKAIRSAP